MLTAKMDLLMKRLNEHAHDKAEMQDTVQALDAHMSCKVYGNTRHSGNDCPKTYEDVLYIMNNRYRPQKRPRVEPTMLLLPRR